MRGGNILNEGKKKKTISYVSKINKKNTLLMK